jgi:hypothetical protein
MTRKERLGASLLVGMQLPENIRRISTFQGPSSGATSDERLLLLASHIHWHRQFKKDTIFQTDEDINLPSRWHIWHI